MQQTPMGQLMWLPMTAMDFFARSLHNWSQPGSQPGGWNQGCCSNAPCFSANTAPPIAYSPLPATCETPTKRGGEPCCGVNCRCGGERCGDGCPCRDRVVHSGGDRVNLIEWSLVEVALGNDSRVLAKGEDLVDQCVTPEEFQNSVIYKWARKDDEKVDPNNLRVYTKVLDSWCKPSWDYEATQIQVLREISARIK